MRPGRPVSLPLPCLADHFTCSWRRATSSCSASTSALHTWKACRRQRQRARRGRAVATFPHGCGPAFPLPSHGQGRGWISGCAAHRGWPKSCLRGRHGGLCDWWAHCHGCCGSCAAPVSPALPASFCHSLRLLLRPQLASAAQARLTFSPQSGLGCLALHAAAVVKSLRGPARCFKTLHLWGLSPM